MKRLLLRLLPALFAGLAFGAAQAQNIDHFAGDGTWVPVIPSATPYNTSAQENVQALTAKLSSPMSLATDAAGNVYIGDQNWHRVRKVDIVTGIITTVAGIGHQNGPGGGSYSGDGGQATAAGLNRPYGVTIAPSGDMYIAEFTGARVRRVDMQTGVIATVAGTGTNAFSGDGGLATAADVGQLKRVEVDADGNIYIANHNRIRKVDAGTGIISTIAGTGTAGYSGDGGQALQAEISTSGGAIKKDHLGNIYFIDAGTHIRKIDPSGIINTIAGTGTAGNSGNGGAATAADMQPSDFDLDAAGNIYIVETSNYQIRKIDAGTGIITTIAGTGTRSCSGDGGPAVLADMCTPEGITLDAAGNIYVVATRSSSAHTCGNCVRKITAPASIHTVPDSYGPVCVSATASSISFDVSYTSTGSFSGAFKVQLSDASGNFPANTTSDIIGAGSASPIRASIPAGTPPGTGYRVRVLHDNPVYYGNDNGSDITVEAGPGAAVISPSGPVINRCSGDSVTLSVNIGLNQTYQWQLNGGNIPGATAYSHTASGAGAYNVLVGIDGLPTCRISSDTVTLVWYTAPSPAIIASGNTLATGTYDSYQWYRNDSLLPGATNQTYTATVPGTYKVEVTDANGCKGLSLPHNRSASDVASLSGISEAINVYPNPSGNMVYVASPVPVNITITGVDGKTVLQQRNATAISIGDLSDGIYIMNIEHEEGVRLKVVRLLKSGK